MSELTLEKLKNLCKYDPESGVFIRLNGRKAGRIIDRPRPSDGYLQVVINGKYYVLHRLAWFYVFGVWPKDQIDHINRIRTDNRIKNLREADDSQNKANTVARGAGLKGTSRVPWGWQAQISARGRAYYLGTFKTAEDAHAAYAQKAVELFGEFANFGSAPGAAPLGSGPTNDDDPFNRIPDVLDRNRVTA